MIIDILFVIPMLLHLFIKILQKKILLLNLRFGQECLPIVLEAKGGNPAILMQKSKI